MSTWLASLKNLKAPGAGATKTTKTTQGDEKGVFVGFVAYPQGHIQKNGTGEPVATKPETPSPNVHSHNGKVTVRSREGNVKASELADNGKVTVRVVATLDLDIQFWGAASAD